MNLSVHWTLIEHNFFLSVSLRKEMFHFFFTSPNILVKNSPTTPSAQESDPLEVYQ